MKRVYLASPYSHKEPAVRILRYRAACQAAAEIMLAGDLVFSPIAHSHVIAGCGTPHEWEFWQNWCLSFLEHWATDLYVLKISGLAKSRGARAEISHARGLGLPISIIRLNQERK